MPPPPATSSTQKARTRRTSDGRRELIIGAPGNNRVYIIKGSATLSGTIDLSTTAASVTLTAPGIGRVLIAGDITGDGIYDLLVGAPSQNVVYAYVGAAGVITTAPAISFSGVTAGDEAGASIRMLDIDDDGKTDLVIDAPGGDGPSNGRANAGNVYVFLGPVTPGAHSLSEGPIVFYGGRRELIIGDRRPGQQPRLHHQGQRHPLSGTIDLSTTAASATLTAPGIGRVLIAGDITGDAVYDLLVGAPTQNLVYAYAGTTGTATPRRAPSDPSRCMKSPGKGRAT